MQVPVIEQCESLVVGSSLEAMVCALSLSAHESVMLVTADTCLYGEITRTGDYALPRYDEAVWQNLLFPPITHDSGDRLHPDRLKLHAEDLFKQRNIKLLYACQVLGMNDGVALIAHKSGLYGIACQTIYRFAPRGTPISPVFCLHAVKEGEHRIHRVPVSASGNSPEAVFNRYREALKQLPRGERLARSGFEATEMAGISVQQAVEQGFQAQPEIYPWPKGRHEPLCQNPLRSSWELKEVPNIQPVDGGKFDVIIAGGGTAGVSAAIAAARQGMRVLLLDMNHQLGGTGTVGGVSTYWFGLRSGITREIDQAVDKLYQELQMPRKQGLWNQNDVFLPDLKAHALLGMCLAENIDVHFGSIVCGVEMVSRRIKGVYWAQNGTLHHAAGRMLVDCTGDGDIAMFAGAVHTYGNEVDGMTYWASLAQYTSPEAYRNNFSTMVHVGDPLDYSRFIQAGRRLGEGMYDHGRYVAPRESRHIHGLATLTLNSILAMKPVEDPLFVCFSNYDPKGRLTSDIVNFGFLPPNQLIPVPRGTHIPVDQEGLPLEGLLVGGKAISCTHDAFPGIRMQPDLQRQGMALGILAACSIRQNVPPLDATGVYEELISAGEDRLIQVEESTWDVTSLVSDLTGEEPWEWLDAPVTSFEKRPSPIVQIMLSPADEALPLLRAAYLEPSSEVRTLVLCRLMLWHGDEEGAGLIISRIRKMLRDSKGLPRRSGSTNYGQLLPDHGLMPEAVYLLNSLSRTRTTSVYEVFLEVTERLEEGPRDWLDLRSGIYCYCESFAYVASVRRDVSMLPLLHRVLNLPEFLQEATDPLLSERLMMLKVTLLSTMHQLGDPQGTQGLEALKKHPKRIIAQAAAKLLENEPTQTRRSI